jgi:hypothetical protein
MNSSDVQNKFLGKRELNGPYNSNLKKKRKKKKNGNTFIGTLGAWVACILFFIRTHLATCFAVQSTIILNL